MTMIKVNIKEFEEKYAKGALIPTDNWLISPNAFLKEKNMRIYELRSTMK